MPDELCPQCGGDGHVCRGDPDCQEECDGCKDLLDCPLCKGSGLVTFSVMERYVSKESAITWGSVDRW